SGLGLLGFGVVRLAAPGTWLPLGPPRGRSTSPPGPSSSNFFFQLYSVNLQIPPMAAKSPAGKPLRCQVSSSNSRCWAVRFSAFTWGGVISTLLFWLLRRRLLPPPYNRAVETCGLFSSSTPG